MRLLHLLDYKDYKTEWPVFFREAVRAVIIKDGLIALVNSRTDGFYKFPGGGVEPNENRFDTLIRETLEETGLKIVTSSIKELGMMHELQKGMYFDEIFEQKSYYYYADAGDSIVNQKLDDYEKEQGFKLVWTDIETAYKANLKLGNEHEGQYRFLKRETFVLKYLLESLMSRRKG